MTETRRLISPSIAFRDAAFDITHCEKFCLVVQVAGDTLTLAVLDNLSNDFLAFEQYVFRKVNTEASFAEQLNKLVNEHEWLTGGFTRVDAMVVTERFTLVPSALYDSAKAGDYLRFNQPVGAQDLVLNDMLRNAEARLIYAIDAELERSLRKISNAVRIRHHLTPLIERNLSVNKNKTARKAFAHVQQGRFDLLVTEGGKLLLANSFNFQAPEDFIYFLLYTCEQLKLNPEEAEVEIAGEIATDSAIAALAKKYIRHVKFASYPVDARFSKDFSQFPAHFHYDLFALHYYS